VRVLTTIGRIIASTLDVLAVVSSLVVTFLMVAQVITRYVLGLSVELLEPIMVAAVLLYMVGAILASRNREHLTVDWLAALIRPPRGKAAHEALIALLTIIMTIFFSIWAFRMFAWALERPQVTPYYRIPLIIPQLSIGLAGVACLGYAIRDLIGALRRMVVR